MRDTGTGTHIKLLRMTNSLGWQVLFLVLDRMLERTNKFPGDWKPSTYLVVTGMCNSHGERCPSLCEWV